MVLITSQGEQVSSQGHQRDINMKRNHVVSFVERLPISGGVFVCSHCVVNSIFLNRSYFGIALYIQIYQIILIFTVGFPVANLVKSLYV